MPSAKRSPDDFEDHHTVNNRQSNIQGMHRWSTSPNDLPAFVQVLHKHLLDITKFRTLIQYNYVVDRRTVCCLSTNHIERIRNKILPKGTPSCPCNISRNDVTLIPGVTSPPAGPPPVATTPAASAPSAAPPSTPAPTVASTSSATPAAPGTTDQYAVVPETVEIAKEELAKEIAAWIDDEDVAESYLDDAANDGIVMLVNLNKDSADAVADSANLCTSVLAEIISIEDAGLADAQVATFNDYKRRLNSKRKVLSGTDYAITDPIFAGKLVAAVRKLGPFVATNL